ncbi:glycerophosphodiester phosphodiesterase [Sedimentibacter sp. zth1]|uniref:glycerophosphodiester phosphodiesterase n=1 Tax=Sedimentibacter sp. zth1 TaxID=2816908 RepID=UPI001A936B1E|nr:glycerophosphodiester phosphodiesterase [Sedimentibacter sp. zth1]QSX05199.1 glycerophosphodiester phosphodiesterase [Sedimentibacter sp. zth1]
MTKVWAHRGAKGYYPENTLISFEGAIKQKADGIELDVQLSKDGYIMVCHDETLNRTTNGKGFIKNYNLYELKQLDAGAWYDKKFKGEKLPLLDEVLELIKGTNMDLNIEIKAGSIFYPGIEEKVIKMVNKFGIKEQVIISSFDHYALLKAKEIDNTIKTGLLYMESLYKPLKYVKTIKVNALYPNYITLNKELVEEANELNVDINTYTVNHEDDAKLIKQLDINAIITDYPDIVKNILENN